MRIHGVAKFVFWTALTIGLVLGLLRVFLVQTWTIPDDDPTLSASLAPALAGGQFVLVGQGLPRSLGNLVRCIDPTNPQRWVVGRIAGLGGDTVEVTDGRLAINGKAVPSTHACKPATVEILHPNTDSDIELRCDMEDLGGVLHMRARNGQLQSSAMSMKRTVPPGTFFLVSDNRAFPYDSFTYGAVPVETCDARVVFRIWGAEGFGDADSRFVWIH